MEIATENELYGGRLWNANMVVIGVGGVWRRFEVGMEFAYGSIFEQVGTSLLGLYLLP